MRLIDGDAVKERLKNDISGMEKRKEKGSITERMEVLSQLSFARYAYAAIITEQTVPAIPLDRIEEAREELYQLQIERINIYEEGNKLGSFDCVHFDEVVEIIDKLIAEVEREDE